MRRLFTLFFFTLLFLANYNARGQDNAEEKLSVNYTTAKSDVERIHILGQLSDFYYSNKNFEKGDSIIELKIMIAEASRNSDLIIKALFGNAGYFSESYSTRGRSEKIKSYMQRALDFARANGLTNYTALAYSNMARLNKVDGKLDEAFNNANLGFTTALSSGNDSVKVICTLELGTIYAQQGKIVLAYKTYTNALDIANKSKRPYLLPQVYHAISELYKKLGRNEVAKDYIFRSLEINKHWKNRHGQVEDFISLGKLYEYSTAKNYLLQAEELSDSIQNFKGKIDAERIMFSYMMLQEKPEVMMNYLNAHPSLKKVYENTGPNYLDWIVGEVFLYGGRPDSAIHYFKRAEPSIEAGYDLTTRKKFFVEYAYCAQLINDFSTAIKFYQKGIELSKASSDFFSIRSSSNELKNIFGLQRNYEQAYFYNVQYDRYRDTIEQMSKDRDLALLEIDNENKRRQEEAELKEEQLLRRHNMQYMGITILIAAAFILLIALGMFKVSHATVRAMGFLSFIFLFEFVIMLLDKWIHHITHGEPIKIWVIKIGIISLLVPFHHYIEGKLIKYLLSHKLIHISKSFSFRKFFAKFKKEHPAAIENAESPEVKPSVDDVVPVNHTMPEVGK